MSFEKYWNIVRPSAICVHLCTTRDMWWRRSELYLGPFDFILSLDILHANALYFNLLNANSFKTFFLSFSFRCWKYQRLNFLNPGAITYIALLLCLMQCFLLILSIFNDVYLFRKVIFDFSHHTKGKLLSCDFTHGWTHGGVHNYLEILPYA